jgi:hypothetical protein
MMRSTLSKASRCAACSASPGQMPVAIITTSMKPASAPKFQK